MCEEYYQRSVNHCDKNASNLVEPDFVRIRERIVVAFDDRVPTIHIGSRFDDAMDDGDVAKLVTHDVAHMNI
mgnify:CR=1 FL=1